MPHGAVVVIGRADRHDHRRQMRRVQRRQGTLVAAGVRVAHGAHLSRAPRLRAQPFDRRAAVLGLLREGVPLPFRSKPPAHVLDDANVAAPGEVFGLGDLYRRCLVVRRALQDDRECSRRAGAAGGRKIDVRGQRDAVSHGRHDVALNQDVVGLVGTFVVGRHRFPFTCRGVMNVGHGPASPAAQRPVSMITYRGPAIRIGRHWCIEEGRNHWASWKAK